jgi:Fe-S cluster biogenesis protein NfuA
MDVADETTTARSTAGSPTGELDGPAGATVGPEEIERRKQALADLITMMRPAVQMDGGDLALLSADYATGAVEVQLQGACGSCAISDFTLDDGVKLMLRERLEWVTDVVASVEEMIDPAVSAAMGKGNYVPRTEEPADPLVSAAQRRGAYVPRYY